jgi:hypothetical protein
MARKKTGAELYQERLKRLEDAIQLKVPDRVPIFVSFGYFPAKYAGVTCEDAFFNPEKWNQASKKTILDFDPDTYQIAVTSAGPVLEALGSKQILMPGRGISPYHSHQFVEGEYMKADEYDAFLADPTGFFLRVYGPRVYSGLGALSKLPPLERMYWGLAEAFVPGMFTGPEFAQAFAAVATAGRETAKWNAINSRFNQEMEDLGYPPATRPHAMAPFDLITDNLRGMKGSMLDMYRQPDKVVAACEKILPWVIERTISAAKATGVPRVFIPLHRGAEGFMSITQFEKFYWPTFKALLLVLIDAGLTPCPFFEGDYTSRLEYLLELPRGKIMGHFDTTDIFKAKEIIGKHVCIRGNFPVSLLQTGTAQEVKDHTKKLIDVVGKDGGYIMSARGSLDEAKPENVKVWIDYTKEYGVYR